MTWKDYGVSVGDTVSTPNGVGQIRRMSEDNGYAHVQVGGQLFETALVDIAPEGAEPSGEFKEGDRVQKKDNPNSTGKVTAVSQRSVQVKWDANGKSKLFAKKTAGEMLEKEGSAPKKEEKKEQIKDENVIPTPEEQSTAESLYGILGLQKHMENIMDGKLDEELQEIKDLAKQKRQLEININDTTTKLEGLKHKQLEQLITYSALRLNPLLVGMAGTGKTHAGEQVSQALKLPFYAMSVGAQTSKSDIIGYMSASGQYVTTHFRKAYETGGIFLMDEIDAGNANVLIQVNAALSNGMCAFPDKMVKRHEDFIFIASANTYGNGANRQYVGRNQLDAATLDRFAVIDWLIDDELESSLTTGLNGKAWYMAVKAARDYIAEKNIRALVSPRATQKGSKLLDIGQPLDEVIDATMLASVPNDKRQDVREVATKIFEKFASQVPKKLSPEVDPPTVKDLIR